MAKWKPGSGFKEMIEQTRQNDLAREYAREDAACGVYSPCQTCQSPSDCGACEHLVERNARITRDTVNGPYMTKEPQVKYSPPSEVNVLFTDEGQVPFGSLQAFYDHLTQFDWFCGFCDAYGCAAADAARRDEALMDKWNKLEGPAGDLYRAYKTHMFTGGSFSNHGPKQPKPARPGGGMSPKELKDKCMKDHDCDYCDFRDAEHGGPHCHTLS